MTSRRDHDPPRQAARGIAGIGHPRIVATAHTAALTSDYFAAASRRLGDALARYLDHQPPAGLLR
jgi:phosphoglycerate dehydrogenase-like enzyme